MFDVSLYFTYIIDFHTHKYSCIGRILIIIHFAKFAEKFENQSGKKRRNSTLQADMTKDQCPHKHEEILKSTKPSFVLFLSHSSAQKRNDSHFVGFLVFVWFCRSFVFLASTKCHFRMFLSISVVDELFNLLFMTRTYVQILPSFFFRRLGQSVSIGRICILNIPSTLNAITKITFAVCSIHIACAHFLRLPYVHFLFFNRK